MDALLGPVRRILDLPEPVSGIGGRYQCPGQGRGAQPGQDTQGQQGAGGDRGKDPYSE